VAGTYTYNDALAVAKAQYSPALTPLVEEYVINNAVSKMWMAYDWRGTVALLYPFWLVPGEQDYGSPFYSVPTDFFGIREAYLLESAGTAQLRHPIHVVENLERTHIQSFPKSICYRPSISGFRVNPTPTLGMACPNYMIDGTYKTKPPKITRATMATNIFWDDVYFNVFGMATTWAALLAAGKRQEAMEMNAIFSQTLDETTSNENQELGDPIVHPSEGLGIGYKGSLFYGPGSWL
jgi:hypothetical protein